MAILGITNRAENWKTARYFAPLFGHASVRLARRLAGADSTFEPGQVRLELFWRPIRDWQHQKKLSRDAARKKLVAAYEPESRFRDLRKKIEDFGGFKKLTSSNYTTREPERLASNLANTEIDIVLESPEHLFIGEAKHETSFHASSRDVLTHQLIRQYVTARILTDLLGLEKKVIPFVVGDHPAELAKQRQAEFMVDQGWMDPAHILEWGDIEALR